MTGTRNCLQAKALGNGLKLQIKAKETSNKTLCLTMKGMKAGFIFLPCLHRAGLGITLLL
jgi:hypothetical protein